ncbi:MAG: Fur family transcriptional regulator [Patescibacteria group bacterium]|nr:Fur family transcriptional regulator [Patescibacteria group bacterium]
MMIKKLKQAGFKITKPRKAVIDALQSCHEPKSAQELHQNIKDVDLVSVYRTLEILEEIGAVWREDLQGMSKYYFAQDSHHHIVCRKCGKIECLPCTHTFEVVKGFKKIKHQLTLEGTCLVCLK